VRILLVSQMYPGPDAPDLGTFVAQVERGLVERGHEVDRAVLDTRAGGKLRYLELARRTLRASRPDVVYAHFLVPSGLIAALGSRAPLVVTAHGQDVRNIGELPGIAAATRIVVRRAATVVCVSDYLRRELETRLPSARGKTEVVSSGVDLERFAVAPAPAGPPRFVCVGALEERKNVVRLADAFAQFGEGTLMFVGDGPLRPQLEGRAAVTLVGRVQHDEIPGCSQRATCCASRASSSRSARRCSKDGRRTLGRGNADRRPARVRAARAGVLVDPLDVEALADALRQAASMPCPNAAARAAAAVHDVRREVERIEAILSRAAAASRRA
jgi:glycosyltransferase involved in cell wall biosynthesis